MSGGPWGQRICPGCRALIWGLRSSLSEPFRELPPPVLLPSLGVSHTQLPVSHPRPGIPEVRAPLGWWAKRSAQEEQASPSLLLHGAARTRKGTEDFGEGFRIFRPFMPRSDLDTLCMLERVSGFWTPGASLPRTGW